MELVLKTSDVERHRGFKSLSLRHMPKWWNGRRDGLKIHCWQQRAGSSPAFGTKCRGRKFSGFSTTFHLFKGILAYFMENIAKNIYRAEFTTSSVLFFCVNQGKIRDTFRPTHLSSVDILVRVGEN